jgi:hypothetical protein
MKLLVSIQIPILSYPFEYKVPKEKTPFYHKNQPPYNASTPQCKIITKCGHLKTRLKDLDEMKVNVQKNHAKFY